MAKKTRNTLKGYFETGDIPTQNQYQDLIDSYVSLNDTEVNPQIINTNFSASGYISTETHITASGNISASGRITASHLYSSDDAHIEDDLTVDGDILLNLNSKIASLQNSSNTYIELQSDDGWNFRANGAEGLQIFSNGVTVNENGIASMDFRVESDTDTHAFFVDAGNNKVAIGTDTVGNSLLTIDGDVTAANITASNISASGTIIADKFQSTGGDVNGISFVDDLNVTGDITASNIRATDITASSVNTTALTIAGAIYGQSTDTFWASGSSGKIYYNGGNVGIGTTTPGKKLEVIGNISASSDIMASRLVIEDNIVGGIAFGQYIIGNNSVPVQIKQNYLTVDPGGFGGHITASGNISASGNIIAPQFHIGGDGITPPVFITHHVAGDNLQIVNGGLLLQNNITASGNISSSGKITGLTGSFGRLEGLSPITIGSPVVFSGSVTMSNQISSSGNILGSTGSFNSMILSNLPTSSVNLPTGSVWVSGSTVISGVNCGTLMITL